MYNIYLVTNKINGKRYVGFTRKTIAERWKQHCYKASANGEKYALQLAIEKYGPENFSVILLESGEDETYGLNERERFFIESINPEYNQTTGGDGVTISPESRKKISNSLRGKKRSPETIQKMKESRKRQVITEEAKLKMAAAAKRRCLNPEEKLRLKEMASHPGSKNGRFGKPVSTETREKLRAGALRQWHGEP